MTGIDSRNKRASILGLGMSFMDILPTPTGLISESSRQQLDYSYVSVVSGTTPPPTVGLSGTSTYLAGPPRGRSESLP